MAVSLWIKAIFSCEDLERWNAEGLQAMGDARLKCSPEIKSWACKLGLFPSVTPSLSLFALSYMMLGVASFLHAFFFSFLQTGGAGSIIRR